MKNEENSLMQFNDCQIDTHNTTSNVVHQFTAIDGPYTYVICGMTFDLKHNDQLIFYSNGDIKINGELKYTLTVDNINFDKYN